MTLHIYPMRLEACEGATRVADIRTRIRRQTAPTPRTGQRGQRDRRAEPRLCMGPRPWPGLLLLTFIVHAEVVLRQSDVVVLVLGAPGARQRSLVFVHHRVQQLHPVHERALRIHHWPSIAQGGHLYFVMALDAGRDVSDRCLVPPATAPPRWTLPWRPRLSTSRRALLSHEMKNVGYRSDQKNKVVNSLDSHYTTITHFNVR